MRVADIMTRDLFTARSELRVREALARAAARDVHHLLVVDRGRLVGVTCVCELRERDGNSALGSTISRLPEVIWPESTLKQAAKRFMEKRVSCFPVCDGGAVVGVITRGDLRRSLVGEQELPASHRCAFCGSTRHVRPMPMQPDRGACLECMDRMAPMDRGFYEEGTKG